MSLVHWWPLNGDLQDKIQGKIFNNGGWTSASSGKIGTTYNANIGAILSASLSIPNTFSFACWVKNNDLTYPQAPLPMKFSNGAPYSTASTSNKGWEFSHGNNSKLTLNNGSTAQELNFGTPHVSYLGSWYHLVFTVDCHLKKASLFINGELKGEKSFTITDFSGTYTFSLGQIHGWKLDGFVNDIRIYDHALSQAEVKELSKALVVHYTFNDICAEPTTNLVAQGVLGWSKLSVNVSSSHNNGVYTITTTTANSGTSGQIRANFPLAILTTGATYYFSCKYKVISGTGAFSFSDWCDSSLSNTKIKDCGDFYEMSTKCYTTRTYNSTYRFLDFNISANSVIEVWDVQLQTNDKVTPYVLGSRGSMLHNETGLIQPTYNTNLNLVQDSASGTFSLSCAGNTMINTPVTGDITAGTTISCWIKVPTYPSANAIVFADYNSKLAFGFYDTKNAIISCGGYGAPYVSNIKGSWVDGWNHVVVTRNSGGAISCYLNGVKLSTTGSNNWSSTSGYSTIGGRYNGSYTTYFTGYIDDYRVYHTLLSEADIQDLYKTKAYITEQGDMETHQFIEGCSNLQVTHNGCAETHDIQEIGNAEYEQLEYIASTGTQYIDTGVYWTSEKATIVADLMVTTWKASSTIFGSEERYSGSNRYFAHILHAGSANGSYTNYIGTGSIGNTTLTKDTRSVIEYIAHGDKKATTRVTVNGTTTTYINNKAYSGTILTRQNSTQTAANRGNIYIFANHNAYNGTAGIQNMAAMRLYRFTMIQDDIYIRDFIPCRRKSDGKVGLFDLVTGQFYTSPVGNFTAGSVVSNEDMQVQFISGNSIQARQIIEL